MKKRILVVDDDAMVAELLTNVLELHGYRVFSALTGEQGLKVFDQEQVDLVILDYSLPDRCGEEVFHQLKKRVVDIPVIFLTGFANLDTAVGLMKAGVCDYVSKPFQISDILSRIDQTFERRNASGPRLGNRLAADDQGWGPGQYTAGTSRTMQLVDFHISTLPQYPRMTVLICGPTGTGKSAVARKIHQITWGDRAPFVEIDCSTIPRELCESELFGHEKGAFTGAHMAKPGLFEAAGEGTAFLDEIGELDLPLQAKLLRVLEERRFKRVGGQVMLPMAARVIAATNRNLRELVSQGSFRQDLYFRLNVFEFHLPSLQQRPEDIPLLAKRFLDYYTREYQKQISGFTQEALQFLQEYDYPGNIRELRNIVERSVVCCSGNMIDIDEFMPYTPAQVADQPAGVPSNNGWDNPGLEKPAAVATSPMNLVELEREKLLQALEAAGGNKSKAAHLVGLSRTAFHRRLKKHHPS